ncbi:MAG: hypothetical protein VB087_12165 [Candidatus Limiplasma sp.]|nr:hypothetical protein [Candidatus Limiplasma sp.]
MKAILCGELPLTQIELQTFCNNSLDFLRDSLYNIDKHSGLSIQWSVRRDCMSPGKDETDGKAYFACGR